MERLFEHTVLRGLLNNRPDVLREADALRDRMASRRKCSPLSEQHTHVAQTPQRYPLHIEELKAILKLQSVIRTWLVRKRLYIKFTMLMNLVKSGSTSHLYDAKVYEIINKNRKRR